MNVTSSSSSNSASYNPCYIVDIDPKRFGGQQSDYIEQARHVINLTAKAIDTAKQSGADLQIFFLDIIAYLSRQRARIAKEHGTRDGPFFGRRRDRASGSVAVLVCSELYTDAGRKIAQNLAGYLKQMETVPGSGRFKEHIFNETCLGRSVRVKIEVLDGPEMIRRRWLGERSDIREPDYLYTPDVIAAKDKENRGEVLSEKEHALLRSLRVKFKSESPELYQLLRLRQLSMMLNMMRINGGGFPSRENGGFEPIPGVRYVHAVLRIQVDKELYAFTHYFSMIDEEDLLKHSKDPTNHPLEHMMDNALVMLLHQDEQLIEPTLRDIAKIFERVVKWNAATQSLEALQEQMALLLYMATHNIRDSRGTAAENEWLARAIYEVLGVQAFTSSDQVVDIEAFAHPFLSEFVKTYKQMVTLKLRI